MDYSLESVSFLDTRISIKDRHLSTSFYRKPTDDLTMLHFSSFHVKHIKTAISYGQALRRHRICSDKEEQDGHLKVLKDALIGTGYDAQLSDRQFRCATVKNCIGLFRRQAQDTSIRVPFVIQYFPGAEKLRHALHSLQHIIDDDEHLTKIFPMPSLLPPNNCQNLNRPVFAANYPAFRTTSTTTLYDPIMATSARHVRSSTWTLPSHVETPPTTCMADTQVTPPMLSISYTAGKDAPRH
eukprot:g20683.t1